MISLVNSDGQLNGAYFKIKMQTNFYISKTVLTIMTNCNLHGNGKRHIIAPFDRFGCYSQRLIQEAI